MSKRDVRNRVVGKGIIFVFTLSLFLSWLGVTMAFEPEVGDSLGYKAFTGFGLIAGLVALIWGTCLGIGLVARSKNGAATPLSPYIPDMHDRDLRCVG